MLEKSFCIGSCAFSIDTISPLGYQWESLCLDTKGYRKSRIFKSYENCVRSAKLYGLQQLIKRLDQPAAIIDLHSDEIYALNFKAIEIFKIDNPIGLNDSQFWENRQEAVDYKKELMSTGKGEKKLRLLDMSGGGVEGMSNDILFPLGGQIVNIARLKI